MGQNVRRKILWQAVLLENLTNAFAVEIKCHITNTLAQIVSLFVLLLETAHKKKMRSDFMISLITGISIMVWVLNMLCTYLHCWLRGDKAWCNLEECSKVHLILQEITNIPNAQGHLGSRVKVSLLVNISSFYVN